MALPVDVRDLMKSGSRFMEERSQPVRIAVLVEVDAPDELIETVRVQLRPTTSAAALQVEVAELGAAPRLEAKTDVVIALAGSGNVGLREALVGPHQMRVPVVVGALGEAARVGMLADTLQQPTGDVIVRENAEDVLHALGSWIADRLGSKRLALAHNFAFMRHAVADEAVKTTALQNALIGAVTPIPGADMPIMTGNQIKMLLQIAAAYGQPLNVERVKELAAVVGGGFVFRALAREALTVIPVLGWAIKGGIGYTGTIAMGKAAEKYFEEGADLGQVASYFRSVRDKAAEGISQARGRRGQRRPLLQPVQTALPLDQHEALPSADQGVLPLGEHAVSPASEGATPASAGEPAGV